MMYMAYLLNLEHTTQGSNHILQYKLRGTVLHTQNAVHLHSNMYHYIGCENNQG